MDPAAKITVVTHADGVDFLMDGAKDNQWQRLTPAPWRRWQGRGVKFEICEITLRNRNLKKDQFIQEAEFTPSGVVRIAKSAARSAAPISSPEGHPRPAFAPAS